MKVLFTGYREMTDPMLVARAHRHIGRVHSIIHGDCRGADKTVDAFYKEHCPEVKVIAVPAEWKRLGASAGPIRNAAMLDMKPDIVVAFLSSKSKGTRQCIRAAKDRNIPVLIYWLD